MPILVVLHLLIAGTFAFHAVRSGQPLFWLIILFSFPVVGSAVYFFAVFLPQTRIPHAARKLAVAAGRAMDPGRALREAAEAYKFTPTAQNRMRLAAALLEDGQALAAAEHFEGCLQGPFATDLDLRFNAARAFGLAGQGARAIAQLRAIRQEDPNFRGEQLALELARDHAAAGDADAARAEFDGAVQRFGTFEARAEYLIWLLDQGDRAAAEVQQQAVEHLMQRWSRATRDINAAAVKRLEAARRRVGR